MQGFWKANLVPQTSLFSVWIVSVDSSQQAYTVFVTELCNMNNTPAAS